MRPTIALRALAFAAVAPPTSSDATENIPICRCAVYALTVPISWRYTIIPQAAKIVDIIVAIILVLSTLMPAALAIV
jgi:hypothetical protein